MPSNSNFSGSAMTLTSEEMRLIRALLTRYVETSTISTSRSLSIADKLLRCDFPHIPEAVKVKSKSFDVPAIPNALLDDGQPDVRITSHNNGYLIECRRRAPYKFYPVEWFADHTFAKMMVDKCLSDPQFRV